MAEPIPITALPRGRHSLSRAEVQAAQRLRLVVALAEELNVAGYARTPVAVVLKRAGISRQTFYELYEDKRAAFLDALDVVGEVLLGELQSASAGETPPRARARAAVDRYLTTLADHLPFARLFLVEVHAVGPEAMGRRAAIQDRLVDELVTATRARRAADRFACRAYVAAVASLVALPVATGDPEAIAELRGPLLTLLDELFERVVRADEPSGPSRP